MTRREPRWHQRMTAASTPVEELEVAYDRLRAALARACRKRRDPALTRESETVAAATARDAVAALSRSAQALEDREKVRR